MKSVAVAVAAAGLVTAVAADTASQVQWETWSSSTEKKADPTTASTWVQWTESSAPAAVSTTSSKPVEAASTTTPVVWESWSSTSEKKADPTTSSSESWSEWSSSTSSSKVADPTTSAVEWESWSSTSEKKADPTTSSVEWESWSSTSSEKKADPTTSVEWESWSSSSKADPSSTWAEWSSSKTPVAASTASSTWAEWESTSTTTVKSTATVTKTVEPVAATSSSSSSSSETWAEWSSSSAAAVSTVSAGWSSAGWFGAAWPTAAAGECVMNVVTSYGYPTWNPVPEATTTSSASSTWAEWVSSTSSASVSALAKDVESSTWAEWSSSSTSDAATSTASSTWAEWTSSSSTEYATSTASSTWAVWSSASASSSSSSAQASSTGSSLADHGNKWSMTYSPYTASGACKDSSTVEQDISKMSQLGFSSVRVYSTDCHTLEYVGNACRSHNMKMILGVFISSTGISGAAGQVTDITSWAQWDLVELIVIGNEAVFQGYCSASELAGFVGTCKKSFQGAGYNGAVTITEPLEQWQSEGSTFCGVVDVVSANLYAFFNPQTTADQAGTFIQSEIEVLSKICPGKDTYVMESGWPSEGECNGAACPSKENQATAIKSIQEASGAKVVFFSFEDESWKQPGQFGVEQHWGCSDVFDSQWSKW